MPNRTALLLVVAGVALGGATAYGSRGHIPARWKNCTAVNKRYPNGVGRNKAHDKTTGVPVTNFKHSTRLYRVAMSYNKRLDADKDGIACEQHTVSWGTAIEVPGTAVLNAGGNAQVQSVSCSSAGECSAGGYYTGGAGRTQAFVVSETSGVWRKAMEVPGTAVLNTGGAARVNSVSCASAGNCAAGGAYVVGAGHRQAFVASETGGIWRKAIEVPGTAALNIGADAQVVSVSCAGAGNCAAAGYYHDGLGHSQAFVVNGKNGAWDTAIEVPGTAALNAGSAAVWSVSCTSAGNCAAGGSYQDGSNRYHGFVVSEKNGVWGTAIELPVTAALNTGDLNVNSVSCSSAGNCAAGGTYHDGSNHPQVFVVSEKNGVWGKAIEVPGMGALNTGGTANLRSVSCASAGNCVAGGNYQDGSNHQQAFVVTETAGVWRKAIEVPGTAALNSGGIALVNSVSCVGAGNCAAAGYYHDGSDYRPLVVRETNGVWGKAVQVPGTATLNATGYGSVNSVSCAPAGPCALGGGFRSVPSSQALVTAP